MAVIWTPGPRPTNRADTGISDAASDNFSGFGGNDTLIGGAGSDLLQGGDGIDLLAGGGGSDTIIGDRGNDIFIGGFGDDRLIWNNGDGSDRISGNAGDDVVEVNGAAAAGDTFRLEQDAQGRAIFDRLNLVPFTLTVDTAESFEVNGGGGDDITTWRELASVQSALQAMLAMTCLMVVAHLHH
ncbi:hypothetical protein LC612_05560 [Nostoc sp. CHAB 5834]|nr:hypothetical protein [Nostoc sp. CHAB 5834]